MLLFPWPGPVDILGAERRGGRKYYWVGREALVIYLFLLYIIATAFLIYMYTISLIKITWLF